MDTDTYKLVYKQTTATTNGVVVVPHEMGPAHSILSTLDLTPHTRLQPQSLRIVLRVSVVCLPLVDYGAAVGEATDNDDDGGADVQSDFWPHVGSPSPVDNIIDGAPENICTLNRLLTVDDDKKEANTQR